MSTPVPFLQMGVQGLNKYQAREALPPGQFAVMQNVRSFRGKLETSPGRSTYLTQSLSGRPMTFFWWQTDTLMQVLNLATTKKLYRLNTGTIQFTDITRAAGDYTGGPGNFWDATAFNNIALFTNGVEKIQVDDGSVAQVTELSGNGAPGTCLALTTFQTYTVAGWVDGSARKIMWSDAGNYQVWNSGDASNLTLFQDPGPIYRLLQLGELLVAYRPTSIHILFYVGSPFVFAQRQIIANRGIVGPRAVADLGPRHVCWMFDGIYLFDGAGREPIGEAIFDDLMDDVDPQFLTRVRVFVDLRDREVYFAYPKSGDEGVCKQAYVWNYQQNTWRQEDITVTAEGLWRRYSDLTWAQAVGDWASWPFTWLESVNVSDVAPICLIGTDAGLIQYIDRSTVNVAGSARTRTAESGLFSPGQVLFNRPGSLATLNLLKIEQENKGSHNLEVWIGTQDTLTGNSGITWTQYTVPASGGTQFLPVRHTAVWFAIRFRTSGTSEPFRLSGCTAYFAPRGDH